MFILALLPLFALSVAAIKVTAPSNNTGWTTSGPQVIMWDTVSTDPSNFTIQLISPSNPNAPTTLAQNVMTGDKMYTYTPESSLAVGGQWRVNIISSTNQAGILAQSDYFEVKQGDAVVSSSGSASASASSTGSASMMSNSASAISQSLSAGASAANSAIPGAASSSRAAGSQTLAQASGLGLVLVTVLGYFA